MGLFDPSSARVAAPERQAASRLSFPILCRAICTAPSKWSPAKSIVAAAVPPHRISARANSCPPVCNTPERTRDLAPAHSETPRWLPEFASDKGTAPQAAHALKEASDQVPRLYAHTLQDRKSTRLNSSHSQIS